MLRHNLLRNDVCPRVEGTSMGCGMKSPRIVLFGTCLLLSMGVQSVKAANDNMSVRFLGINGFEFTLRGETLLIDPYVSRDHARVCIPKTVRKHIKQADYILLTHSHWDHAGDVAEIAKYTDAVIVGSETMLNICRHFKIAESRLRQYENRRTMQLGAFSVTPLKSKHKEPVGYPGYYRQPPTKIKSASDYLEGGTWALSVNCGGYSFLNLGSANLIDTELEGIECDYLLAGISGRAADYLPRLLKCVRAKVVIPTHWDNFFGHPVEAPGERVSLREFHEEMKRIAPQQKVKVLEVLDALRLPSTTAPIRVTERQLTHAPHGHILTNVGAWSADGSWIVYDVRSDPAGSVFDGGRIERVNVTSGEVETLYTSTLGAHCGVVTAAPNDDRVVFIHGPEAPTPEWSYAAGHRRGVIVHADAPGEAVNLDARDLTPPFTAGALRGGTHVHTFSGDGRWVAFTYEDHVLAELGQDEGHDLNQRNVGVSVPDRPVTVRQDHPRNHHGSHFTVLVTRTVNRPKPGTDEIGRAFSDSWIGTAGYLRTDGTRQKRAIAFQGDVVTKGGGMISEAFVVDLPDDLTRPGDAPLEGTAGTRPAPPRGVAQRRLTFTADRKHPGLQGPRHWLRSSPDGSQIAILMKDDADVVQLWTFSPNGGVPRQLTDNRHDIASAFTFSPDGRWIAHAMDGSVCVTEVSSGVTHRLTPSAENAHAPRPEACIFSPQGTQIACVRPVTSQGKTWNQIFVLILDGIRP